MAILISFLPFIVFVAVQMWKGVTAGLVLAASTSAILLAWNVGWRHKTAKVLECGTAILFGGMTILVRL